MAKCLFWPKAVTLSRRKLLKLVHSQKLLSLACGECSSQLCLELLSWEKDGGEDSFSLLGSLNSFCYSIHAILGNLTGHSGEQLHLNSHGDSQNVAAVLIVHSFQLLPLLHLLASCLAFGIQFYPEDDPVLQPKLAAHAPRALAHTNISPCTG